MGEHFIIDSTMQDFDLTISVLFRHGQRVHGRSRVISFDGEALRSVPFAEVAARTERLAAALASLGVERGDRVATLMWNSQEHLEAYFAVPGMGAILHTLNLRLAPGDLAQVMSEAGDKVVIAHGSLLPLLTAVSGAVATLETVLLVDDPGMPPPRAPEGEGSIQYVGYEDALAGAAGGAPPWPELDERTPAAICYTSGTTDFPRGVAYSHRSTFLHAMCVASGACFGNNDAERVLPLVPMFHVNAWGLPYAAWMLGSDLVMPHRWLLGGPACQLIKLARPTQACGVPTIWASLIEYADAHPDEVDFSSLRLITSGGSALPEPLMKAFRDRYGIQMAQGWGMTETSPVCTWARVGVPGEREGKPLSAGRIVPGVEMRAVAPDGTVAPWDGQTAGEIEVRGPWVTGRYIAADGRAAGNRFHDGWLRTGDLGTIDEDGSLVLADRLKDVIKSGGEWISSLRLENELLSHPAVLDVAVIGVPDDKWGERPMAFIVLRAQEQAGEAELAAHLEDRVPHFWVPSHWSYVSEIPKTTVGKIDKLALREWARQPG
ncbi:MAG TPA: fatty acid--CoA ligase [Acidimicrobiales bacterium]|nr:fatty acid--CoA ligase [Acidimicrobiales bacterium]